MLHLIRPDVEGKGRDLDMKVALAINDHSRDSALDHIMQRVGTGFQSYRGMKQFIDADDFRFNDAIAISDQLIDDEIMHLVQEYANQIPVLIFTADPSACQERLFLTRAYPNVEFVLAPVL